MIRRLYVDNFRSLVDFTWEPGKETLVLGYNGSGKTSALEVIQVLREWATGQAPLGHLLSRSDWTSWRAEGQIRLELDLLTRGRGHHYSVSFALDDDKGRYCRQEELVVDGTSAFQRDARYVTLQPDVNDLRAGFPIARTLSVLSVVGDNSEGKDMSEFRDALSAMVYAKPNPRGMDTTAGLPVAVPSASLEDLSGWLLHLLKNKEFQSSLAEMLKDAWPELRSVYHLAVARDFNRLTLLFDTSSDDAPPLTSEFEELSDGERMLVALYTLAAYQKTYPPTTIIVDEPDNYVSLLEIQPWLLTMLDDRPDDGQLILISHNPEIIQTMGRERVAYFSREDHSSSTKVSALPPDEGGLSLSELLARGWIDV